VAKLFSFQYVTAPSYLVIAWPHVLLVVPAIEVIVGAGMLFSRFDRTFILAGFILFVGFAVVSAVLLFNGVTSCGCFGAMDTSVVGVLAIVVAVSLGLG
jgi:hypothetical protein